MGEPGLELVAIHADEGLSGKRADNRPGLVAALDAACRAKAVLVVYSLSRMSPSVTDALAIVGRLNKAGAGFVSLTESIDTTTAAGRVMVTMLAAFEREQTAERTATVLHHKRANGERTDGVPFGWADEGGRLVPIAEEQVVLERIAACRAAGLSYREIAAELTAAGILTKQGKAVWTHTAVASIVKRAAALAAWGRRAGGGSGNTSSRRSSMSKAPKPIDTALRNAIRSSGLTHNSLGKAVGVAPAQLDRFVSGERSLTLGSAAKVAAALGLVLVPRR